MRARAPWSEKPLHWVGSSKRDLLGFPEQVVDNIGYALGLVQYGGYPPSAKPWKGLGPGVSEIVEVDSAGPSGRFTRCGSARRFMCCMHSRKSRLRACERLARTWG